MFLASCDCHLAEVSFEVLDDGCDNCRVFVRDLRIVDVPGDGTLLAVDHLVRDTRVIRIQNETHLLQDPAEKLVPEHRRLDASVDCLAQANVQYFHAVLDSYKRDVFRVHVAQNLHRLSRELHQDVIVHKCLEVCAGHVCGPDVSIFVRIDHNSDHECIRCHRRRCSLRLVIDCSLWPSVGHGSALQSPIALLFQ